MNSFTLHAVGQLASDPELTIGKGKDDVPYVRFSLLGNDYGGKGREEIVTRVFFVAFGGLAEAIGKNARKGDQLILEVRDFRFWDRPISPIEPTWTGESSEPQATMFIRLCPRLQVFVL